MFITNLFSKNDVFTTFSPILQDARYDSKPLLAIAILHRRLQYSRNFCDLLYADCYHSVMSLIRGVWIAIYH
jgi:hypothetical protein